ncbi:MAG: homoserine O-succinyltransferase [Planctomycetes bacterium]|nr:homoserine O-succinyltransferase [Planctomycetota bacterium]
MPLVAHCGLPTFGRLQAEGQTILSPGRAARQDIRELHIGLLNMMPDTALAATERQFLRLVGSSNQIAQFYVHPFTVTELARGPEAKNHIAKYYETYEQIQKDGLDALIITGANLTQPDLSAEPFWEPLIDVIEWAYENVTSTFCSCLATHAVLQSRHGQKRRRLSEKCWGVFSHRVIDRSHPLVSEVNTLFDTPHSRFNEIARSQFTEAGLRVLVESEEAGVQMAVSSDGFRLVFSQGHPEYDTISLLKEYKREVTRFETGECDEYPPFPARYFSPKKQAILREYQAKLVEQRRGGAKAPEFPEKLIAPTLDNTWHDTGTAIVDKWVGKIYELTHQDRKIPFMESVDPSDPLQLRA